MSKIIEQNLTISMTSDQTEQDTLVLARRAAQGDPDSRKQVNEIAHPIISYQTDRFCKRFCYDNKYQYRCSLQHAWGSASADAHLCEWGNASYGWMLDDLTSSNRLNRFDGRNNARLNDYLFAIANSLPFYERWKDWRFGKPLHVPTYVQQLNEHATKVFRGLLQQLNVHEIAQKHQLTLSQIETVADQIIIELTKRNRLHLLNPVRTVSLTGLNQYSESDSDNSDSHQSDIAWHDTAPEDQDDTVKLRQAWQSLSVAEQFVLEAMLIEEQEASDVLHALKTLDIAIAEGVPAEQTNRQQLYYFRRKTLEKMARLMASSDTIHADG